MIGPLIAAHYIGKKPWGMSALFFVIILVIGLILSAFLGTYLIVNIIIGAIVFLAVAWFYLKIHPLPIGILMYIVSIIINIIISYVLAFVAGWSIPI